MIHSLSFTWYSVVTEPPLTLALTDRLTVTSVVYQLSLPLGATGLRVAVVTGAIL